MPQFIDPRPLYETEEPLSSRVGAFRRYLVVDSASRRLFLDLTQEIAGHSPIADIGCGVGVPLLPVGPTVMDRLDVIAGDISLRQLQSIREGGSERRQNMLQFDATRLPFRTASFGAAVARHMLYHVRDPRLAAAEASRVIRDEGLFVATTNSSSSRPQLQHAHAEAVADLGGRLVERMSTNFDAESGGRKLSGSSDGCTLSRGRASSTSRLSVQCSTTTGAPPTTGWRSMPRQTARGSLGGSPRS